MKAKITFGASRNSNEDPWLEVAAVPATGSYPNGTILKITPAIEGQYFFWINVGDQNTAIWRPAGFIPLPVTPGVVQGLTASVVNGYIVLTWDAVTDLEISNYEVRSGLAWSIGTTLGTPNSLTYPGGLATAGTHYFMVKAIDSLDAESDTATPISITILEPSTPEPITAVHGVMAGVTWEDCKTTVPIDHYEVNGINVGNTLSYMEQITSAGNIPFSVVAVDEAGNQSAAGATTLAVLSPLTPHSTATVTSTSRDSLLLETGDTLVTEEGDKILVEAPTGSIIGEMATIIWNDCKTTLPIDHYEVNGVNVGNGLTYSERINWNGNKEFSIVAVDVAGNESEPGVTSITVVNVTAVTDIDTTGIYRGITLDLTYEDFEGFAKVEIWASATNDRTAAVKVGETETTTFTQSGLALIASRYYWTRIRDIFGSYGAWYPLAEDAGVYGITSIDPSDMLTILTDSITSSELSTDLQTTLTSHTSSITALQDEIASLTTSAWSSTGDYALGRYVLYTDNKVYRCIQAYTYSVDGTKTPGTDTGYWELADAIAVTVADIDTRVDTLESSITQKVSTATYTADQKVDGVLRIATAEATIGTTAEDVDDIKAQYTVKLDVNGRVAGFGLMLSETEPSEFIVVADKFAIVNPGEDGNVVVPFIVDEIDGVATVGINGNLLVDGSIEASSIGTNEIITNAANIADAVITNAKIANIEGDKITAGSIRGINLQGAAHMTKGTYLIASCAAGASVLDVKDTTDFESSGFGWIIDSTNDRDAFTYTGKTASTLTGVSGVLAHTKSATNVPVVVPAKKCMVIADVVNEMRLFDDIGNGTIEEVLTIGSNPSGDGFSTQIKAGTLNPATPTKKGIVGASHNAGGVTGIDTGNGWGVAGQSSSGVALYGTSTLGYGVYATSSQENAGYFNGNATKGSIGMNVYEHNALPSDRTAGQIIIVHNSAWGTDYDLGLSDGTNWRRANGGAIIT